MAARRPPLKSHGRKRDNRNIVRMVVPGFEGYARQVAAENLERRRSEREARKTLRQVLRGIDVLERLTRTRMEEAVGLYPRDRQEASREAFTVVRQRLPIIAAPALDQATPSASAETQTPGRVEVSGACVRGLRRELLTRQRTRRRST